MSSAKTPAVKRQLMVDMTCQSCDLPANAPKICRDCDTSSALSSTEPPLVERQLMVNMTCQSCVQSVEKALKPLEGVKSVQVDLAQQTVTVLGNRSADELLKALEPTGLSARVIGHGSSQARSAFTEDFASKLGYDLQTLSESVAAVAEFKGEFKVLGVVRFVQLSPDHATMEATLDGLSPGEHVIEVHRAGNISEGPRRTGPVYDAHPSSRQACGVLGTVTADSTGHAELPLQNTDARLKVWDIVGRSVVVRPNSWLAWLGVSREGAAAVVARSAGVGVNLKMLCSCDGTVIWNATNKL